MSTPPRRRRGGAAAALAAVLAATVLASCSGEEPAEPEPSPSASESSSTPAAPPPPPPPERACYDLTVTDAEAPTSDAEPVDCRKPHTARTLAVGRVGALTGDPETVADDPAVQTALARECPRRSEGFLGGDAVTRNLSRFVVVWFVPTPAEVERGADWFRCDVVAFGDADRLLELPFDRRLEGILDQEGALDTFGTCGTAAPGAPGFERVACSLPHSWRALTTIRISDAERYPGTARVRESGDGECAAIVEEQAGFTTEIDYGWEWPTKAQWDAGQRYGFCWAPA